MKESISYNNQLHFKDMVWMRRNIYFESFNLLKIELNLLNVILKQMCQEYLGSNLTPRVVAKKLEHLGRKWRHMYPISRNEQTFTINCVSILLNISVEANSPVFMIASEESFLNIGFRTILYETFSYYFSILNWFKTGTGPARPRR